MCLPKLTTEREISNPDLNITARDKRYFSLSEFWQHTAREVITKPINVAQS